VLPWGGSPRSSCTVSSGRRIWHPPSTVDYISTNQDSGAEKHNFVDRESFLVFVFSLALFITGTCGMIGTDEYVSCMSHTSCYSTSTRTLIMINSVLACFIAGNAFTWDDWFRVQTMDDSLQPTVDMLLNIGIFMWYGAAAPWGKFLTNDVIPLYRLVPLAILVLILRRLPWVYAIHKKIHQIEHARQAVFVGFFGPIGVSAIFYLYVTRGFLETLRQDNGKPRPDGK
jgi:sodium/hydrogen antiporter